MITIRCTRSRGPRGFGNNDVCRGPVNVAVIRLNGSHRENSSTTLMQPAIEQLQRDMHNAWSQLTFPGNFRNPWMDFEYAMPLFDGIRYDEVDVQADSFHNSFPLTEMAEQHLVYYFGTYLDVLCEYWRDDDNEMSLPLGDIRITQLLMCLDTLWEIDTPPKIQQVLVQFMVLIESYGCEESYLVKIKGMLAQCD